MRRFASMLAAGALLVPGMAGANRVSIELRAVVAPLCAVQDIRPIDLERGLIGVAVVCNSDSFRLAMGGDLSGSPMRAAQAGDASLLLMGDTVSVQPRRPGEFQFQLDYGRDLRDVHSVTATLEAL